MMISTKGRYALRIMVDLANHRSSLVSVSSIAGRQCISDKYIEQIMTILKRAGFIEATRGAAGGYKLARPPQQYRVGDILRLMEGTLSPVDCLSDMGEGCDRSASCPTIVMWQELKDAISSVVDKYTIADLMQDGE